MDLINLDIEFKEKKFTVQLKEEEETNTYQIKIWY